MKQIRRSLSVLLCMALVLSVLTVLVKEVKAEVNIWDAPAVNQMNFGAKGIVDPAIPSGVSDAWNGCYVYYGNYDVDGDGTAEPVKYRVLDASTTKYSADGKTQTMLLDCDSILYCLPFDGESPYSSTWKNSPIYNSLNGEGFLDKEGVFSVAEKNAIAASTVGSHALTTNSEMGVNVTTGVQSNFKNYVALGGEKIFLLDAEDVSNEAFGYSMSSDSCTNRKKTGASVDSWWLRSVYVNMFSGVGIINSTANIYMSGVNNSSIGVSPAFNLNLPSVLFTSVNTMSKSSPLTSNSTKVGVTTNSDWKLTLNDSRKTVALLKGKCAIKAVDGTITVPYTYTDSAVTDSEKVNQLSVMITDRTYGSENAQILYYGALQNIKNAEGTDSTVPESSTGTGIFALPSGLTGDYHIYLLAEHVSEGNSTDYASAPLEIEVMTPISEVNIPNINVPNPGDPLATKMEVTAEGVVSKASVTWKKGENIVTGNAEEDTTYQAYVALTPKNGYTFMDVAGDIASVTMDGKAVASNKIVLNDDGTLTVDCGAYTTVLSDDKDTDSNEPENDEVTVSDAKMTVKGDGTATYVAPGNKNVTTITIPDTIIRGGKTYKVTAIGKNAFYGCKKLTTVKIGKNVTTIGAKAFYRCTALKKITIPSKVKKIGQKAFYGCSKLKTLTIKTTKLTTKRVGSKAFGKTPKGIKVTIPKKKYKAYKSLLIKKGIKKSAKFKKR